MRLLLAVLFAGFTTSCMMKPLERFEQLPAASLPTTKPAVRDFRSSNGRLWIGNLDGKTIYDYQDIPGPTTKPAPATAPTTKPTTRQTDYIRYRMEQFMGIRPLIDEYNVFLK